MKRDDQTYFAQREADERRSAERAKDMTARRAHLAMAEHYAEKLRAMAQPLPDPA
jgi:hypothetical protein